MKLKLCFISDTHNQLNQMIDKIPQCDYLIHCGDSTNMGTIPELSKVNYEFGLIKEKGLVKKDIICIAGNHDFQLEKSYQVSKDLFTNAIYLENTGMTLSNGMYLYGSPICPRFFNWAFMKERGTQIAEYWDMIPDNTNILITHSPAYGILDTNSKGEKCGCYDLRKRMDQLTKLKYHAHGHIHESYSMSLTTNGVIHINASCMGHDYSYMNDPIMVYI